MTPKDIVKIRYTIADCRKIYILFSRKFTTYEIAREYGILPFLINAMYRVYIEHIQAEGMVHKSDYRGNFVEPTRPDDRKYFAPCLN